LAFLIGIGYFAGMTFRIEQFFLRDPSEERAMLGALGDVLHRFEALITFNGKCFDWPIVETRHSIARLRLRPAAPLHLDLLYPARRLYRRRIGSCALGALERAILRLPPRVGDVPGWLIPTLYFDYLRTRDARPLVPVFEHNRRDILSMLALATTMARSVADPLRDAAIEPLDLVSLGHFFDEAGIPVRAAQCYERAIAGLCLERDTRPLDHHGVQIDHGEVITRLAGVYRRLRAVDRAVELWETLIRAGAGTIVPYVELAKYHEHRRRDTARAAELTAAALRRHELARPFTPPARYATDRRDLEHRLERLRRRIAVRQATPLHR
jgi:hypothetical protein